VEVITKQSWRHKLTGFFLKEKSHFVTKPEINWKTVRNCGLFSLVIGIIVILFLPTPKPSAGAFHEHADPGSLAQPTSPTSDPTQQALTQLQSGRAGGSPFGSHSANGSGGAANQDRSASMILSRGGEDSRTQVPPGGRIAVRLVEKATVTNQGLPIIGVVTRDYIHEDSVAIPQGSKIFGVISFDDASDRAKVDWRAIQLPDGRNRQLSAIGMSFDGQAGVEGNVHSDALKNTVGQTLTRFVGAYAQGSMQTGMLGSNPGGNDNGWKNAIAQTAQDRANALADDLKKEKRWIEISPGTEFYAVLTQAFTFRDPGATYGR
jgi:type IV secretory pathway VirB10-like protein